MYCGMRHQCDVLDYETHIKLQTLADNLSGFEIAH